MKKYIRPEITVVNVECESVMQIAISVVYPNGENQTNRARRRKDIEFGYDEEEEEE